MQKIPLLRSAWNAYFSKVFRIEEYALTRQQKPLDMALRSSRAFFNEESVIELRSELSRYQDCGNILTGLGIFFTFVGLACGIYLANRGFTDETVSSAADAVWVMANTIELQANSAGMPAGLKDSMGQLLGGAGQAFASSVFGILFALLFSMYYKRSYKRIINSIGRLTDGLDELFPVLGDDRIKFAQLDFASKSYRREQQIKDLLAAQTANLSEALKRIEDGITNMSRTQADVLGRFVKKATSEFSDQLAEKMADMTASFEASSTAVGDSVDALSEVLSGMKRALKQAADVSTGSLEGINSQVTEIFAKIEESHRTILSNVQKAEDAFVKVGGELEETSRKFSETVAVSGKDAGSEFTKSVTSSAELWQNQMAQSVADIRQTLDMFKEVCRSFDASLDKYRAAGGQSLNLPNAVAAEPRISVQNEIPAQEAAVYTEPSVSADSLSGEAVQERAEPQITEPIKIPEADSPSEEKEVGLFSKIFSRGTASGSRKENGKDSGQ
jgi:hypothetical protein